VLHYDAHALRALGAGVSVSVGVGVGVSVGVGVNGHGLCVKHASGDDVYVDGVRGDGVRDGVRGHGEGGESAHERRAQACAASSFALQHCRRCRTHSEKSVPSQFYCIKHV